MTTELSTSLKWLYGLQRFGIKLGLEKIAVILDKLGNPEKKFASIHIAGTNGKGSVASMVASVLQGAGLNVGLYTSPHLVRFNERIKINGVEINDDELIGYIGAIRKYVEELRATFFEATTAVAFKHFAINDIDIAIIETGMGGRFDATNVITPLVSVITNIGLEHQRYLGNTYPRIAYEKGGIIKPGVPSISGVQSARAIAVLEDISQFLNSFFVEVIPEASVVVHKMTLDETEVDVYFKDVGGIEGIRIDLGGRFQLHNLLVALRTIDLLRGKLATDIKHFDLLDDQIRDGLVKVKKTTGLMGRMQTIEKNGRWVLDVAHNPGAIREMVNSLKDLGYKNIPIVFGVLNDKDVYSMFRSLSEIARIIHLVKPVEERAIEPEVLKKIGNEVFFPCISQGSVLNGLKAADKERGDDEFVLVTGSHYLVGEVLVHFASSGAFS